MNWELVWQITGVLFVIAVFLLSIRSNVKSQERWDEYLRQFDIDRERGWYKPPAHKPPEEDT